MTTKSSLHTLCFLYFSGFLFSFLKTIRRVTDCLLCFCDLQYGMGSGGGSKASFTPFVDPRVYGTSPTEDDDNISASGTCLVVGTTRSVHEKDLRKTTFCCRRLCLSHVFLTTR